MEIIVGTAASVATTIITVLGAILYLDRKMDANRRELSAEIATTRRELSAEIDSTRSDLSCQLKSIRLEASYQLRLKPFGATCRQR